jgi:hypothetical protein
MGNARGPQKLPSQITLRPIAVMDAAAVREALNASRANIHLWRKLASFPRGLRHGNDVLINTADLASWAVSQSIRVEWL